MKTKLDTIDYILTMVELLHQDEVRKILQELLPEKHQSSVTHNIRS